MEKSSLRSVPDVAFVISNLVARQHAPKLILKTVTAMMFGLVPDVSAHRFYLGEPDRECTVATLPGKRLKGGIPFLCRNGRRTDSTTERGKDTEANRWTRAPVGFAGARSIPLTEPSARNTLTADGRGSSPLAALDHSLNPSPHGALEPAYENSLAHRMGEGRGEGVCRLLSHN